MPKIENPNALKQGTVVNEYIIDTILGSGGFGITYLAKDKRNQKIVVIKEYMPIDFASRSRNGIAVTTSKLDSYNWGLNRFIQEAQIVSAYNHPNIVKVINFFQANQTAYMIMEYVGKINLRQYLEKKGRLSSVQLIAIVEPLLDAVKLIHQSGHLHRDIKPENILISNAGQPILLDFGSARRAVKQLSRPLTAIASDGYSPFEQYLSNTEVKQGAWTDIYALSATFYNCISGKIPIRSLDRMHHDTLIPISSLVNGDYPPELIRMIEQGLIIDMHRRPQSISEWEQGIVPRVSNLVNETSTTYAGFWKRFAASFIDGIIILLGSFIVLLVYAFMMSANGMGEQAIGVFLNIIALFIGLFYYSVMESSSTQATFGKMALCIKVTDLEGNKITFAKASGRYFGKTVSAIILLIGFVMVAFTEKKQGLHDIMSGCLVVNR